MWKFRVFVLQIHCAMILLLVPACCTDGIYVHRQHISAAPRPHARDRVERRLDGGVRVAKSRFHTKGSIGIIKMKLRYYLLRPDVAERRILAGRIKAA